jgi:hypothetical protein
MVLLIDPTGESVIYWDIVLTGFALRVSPKGRKTYIARSRIKGTGIEVEAAIGVHPRFTFDEAKEEARRWLVLCSRGIDPRTKFNNVSGKQQLIWDKSVKGFGMLVSGVSDVKSYVVQAKRPGGYDQRVTIGRVGEISYAEAQEKAKIIGDLIRSGSTSTNKRTSKWTLGRALMSYLRDRSDALSHVTVKEYQDKTFRYLGDWVDKPLLSLTKEMIEERLIEVKKGILDRHMYPNIRLNPDSTVNSLRVHINMLWTHVESKVEGFPRSPLWVPKGPVVRKLKRCLTCGTFHSKRGAFCSDAHEKTYESLAKRKSETLQSKREKARNYQRSYNRKQRAVFKAVREMGLISIEELSHGNDLRSRSGSGEENIQTEHSGCPHADNETGES